MKDIVLLSEIKLKCKAFLTYIKPYIKKGVFPSIDTKNLKSLEKNYKDAYFNIIKSAFNKNGFLCSVNSNFLVFPLSPFYCYYSKDVKNLLETKNIEMLKKSSKGLSGLSYKQDFIMLSNSFYVLDISEYKKVEILKALSLLLQ